MKKILKAFVIPTITLFVICFVATALLGITNAVTAPTIDKLAKQKEIYTRKEVFVQAVDFDEEAKKVKATNVLDIDNFFLTIRILIVYKIT